MLVPHVHDVHLHTYIHVHLSSLYAQSRTVRTRSQEVRDWPAETTVHRHRCRALKQAAEEEEEADGNSGKGERLEHGAHIPGLPAHAVRSWIGCARASGLFCMADA